MKILKIHIVVVMLLVPYFLWWMTPETPVNIISPLAMINFFMLVVVEVVLSLVLAEQISIENLWDVKEDKETSDGEDS